MPNYSSAKIVKKGQFFSKDYQNTQKRNEKKAIDRNNNSRFQWKFFNKEQEQTDIFRKVFHREVICRVCETQRSARLAFGS